MYTAECEQAKLAVANKATLEQDLLPITLTSYDALGVPLKQYAEGAYRYTGIAQIAETSYAVYGSFSDGNRAKIIGLPNNVTLGYVDLPALPIEFFALPFSNGAFYLRNLDSLYIIASDGAILSRNGVPKGRFSIERTVFRNDSIAGFLLANGKTLLPDSSFVDGWMQENGTLLSVNKFSDNNQKTALISNGKDSFLYASDYQLGTVYNWGTTGDWAVFTAEEIVSEKPLQVQLQFFVIDAHTLSAESFSQMLLPYTPVYIAKQMVTVLESGIYVHIAGSQGICSINFDAGRLGEKGYLMSVVNCKKH